MSDIAISIENVSKLYKLGEIGTGTLSQDLNRWWARTRGKEDPFSKLGQENDRSSKGSDWVWALKDISFDVKQGEVLGIIGKNGAGKSSLLKLLSRVTTPTTGTIKAKGKIASLLEVGTGFHPELTGRENVYLNGAILGMTKKEINRKFDEIVDFSGVERYIDTPVKRYSSGMYVRLAFGVAAHMDPEIMIVDEVLAVGDSEFQEKCIGKMKDVSVKEGRTVLFVSHNLGSIAQLCTSCLLLKNGKLLMNDSVANVLNEYNKRGDQESNSYKKENSKEFEITSVNLNDSLSDNSNLSFEDDILIRMSINYPFKIEGLNLGVAILDKYKRKIFTSTSVIPSDGVCGARSFVMKVPGSTLLSGSYSLDISTFIPNGMVYSYISDVCKFDIIDYYSEFAIYGMSDLGVVNIICDWYENS